MLKQLSVAVLGLGVLGTQACVAESGESSQQVGNVGQGMCNSQAGVNPTLAALAVAMADEIGELHPVRDLTLGGLGIQLSSEGRSRCNANGGCDNIDALLSLQNEGVNDLIPNTVFNATDYRRTLVSSYQRQRDTDANLARNNPGAQPEPHELVFDRVTDNGACGPHYLFNAYKTGCNTGCDGLREWDGGNWQFSVANGETIQHAGRKYRANQAIGFPNAECAPDNPAGWCSGWFTDVGDCTLCQMDDPQDIEHRLAFFENGNNPFLAFYASEGQIGIDPSGDMNDGITTSSGACFAGSMAYDPNFTKRNRCCTYNGYYGTFKTSPYCPVIVVCEL